MTECSSDEERACADALDALHEYLDGELAPGRLASIAPHLDTCRRCGLEAEAYRALKEAVRRAGNGVDAAVLDRLRTFARHLGSTPESIAPSAGSSLRILALSNTPPGATSRALRGAPGGLGHGTRR